MYAIGAAVLAVVLLGMRMHWVQVGREAVLRENAAAAVKIVVKQGAVTEKIVRQYVKVAGATQVVTQTVEKEVVKYAQANPGLCLDTGWRLLHDRAAANAVPDPAGRPDGGLRTPPAAPVRLRVAYSLAGAPDGHAELR